MIVLLENGTVGKVCDTKSDVVEVGTWARVELHDENGMPIDDSGVIREILEA